MKKWFVTGIGTEVGKTVASAVLVQALGADYWKPVQAGDLDYTDSHKIGEWAPGHGIIHPERYRLNHPMSPHAAANLDGISIQLSDFELPDTDNHLIVEGAGGLMVPLNNQGDMMVDLIKRLGIPAVLVSRNYLGSINHTLLSIELLRNKGVEMAGILFNGQENKSTEEVILSNSGLTVIGRIGEEEQIDKTAIKKYANSISL